MERQQHGGHLGKANDSWGSARVRSFSSNLTFKLNGCNGEKRGPARQR